jgi:phenylalanyl-tRNA synthetase beta chain
LLAARGYSEVVNFAFVSEDWERDFYGANNPVRLENPIAEQMAVMRSGLLGGLADRALFNFHHRQTRVKFFELGRCFFTAAAGGKEEAEEKIMQPQKIAAFAIGENNPPHWDSPPRAVDFYDVKGDVEALLAGLRPRFAALDKPHPALHPGKAAAVIVGGKPCGFIGELHPRLAAPFRARPAVFELDFDRVAGHIISAPPPQVRSFSKFPQVRRDLAVVVDEAVSAGELLDIAQTFAATDERIAGVALFDRYAGDNIAAGKKSLGLRVLMQGALANIEEREIAALMAGLEKALAAGCGAVRRG